MLPEEDFETWKLILTTVSDDIPSFNSMLPDLHRMMDSIEKTNYLPGDLKDFTDGFIDESFPNTYNSILGVASQMKIEENNINNIETISDFFKSSIKLCITKINENLPNENIANDEMIKIISRKIKLSQLIYKLFDKIDLTQKPNANEKALNQSFLFYFLNDLNAVDQCLFKLDNINHDINSNNNEEILEKKALLVSILFKICFKVIFSTTFESKTFTDKNANKIEYEKQKLMLYHDQIGSLLSKSFSIFEKISKNNLRKFDPSLLDSIFETFTKSVQLDFIILKEDNFPLTVNLLEPSYLNILSIFMNCSFFDKTLYSLKTLSLLCSKTSENYKNNKDYFESDELRKKLKLKVFFVDKEILLSSIIDNLSHIQNLPFNKEFGEPLGTIYSFIMENNEDIISVDYLKYLLGNIQFVFAADQGSFYKIFEKISKVLNESNSEELVDYILQQNKETINKSFLDFLYSIALNFQKNKFKDPFLKIRHLFWSISFDTPKNEENEFARKKINSLCHYCSNEIVEKLINDKFQLIQEVSEDDKENKSSIEKENEFILKLCENSINKDEEEINPDLCTKIVHFCASHLKDENAINLLTKVCTTQKVTLDKEQIEQLSNTSNKFLTKILFSSGFDDDYIESLILSLNNIDSDLYELIEKYVLIKNKQWESIENDYLTNLPFEKEDLLWTFSLKESKVQKQFMNKLCQIYSNNDGVLLTDEKMIKFFLNRIENELDKKENKNNILQLLHRFVNIVDETNPNLLDIKKHNESVYDSVNISIKGIKKTFQYSKKNSTLVAYYQAAKELNVPLNQLTLIYDDSPVQMSKAFSEITYLRTFLDFIPIIEDSTNIKIRHLRTISPTFIISRSNLMNKLISYLSEDNEDEKKDDKNNSFVLIDLLNDLPTSKTTYTIINNFDKVDEIDFKVLFPIKHWQLFMYNLHVLKNIKKKIKNEFVKKNGTDYFISALTKVDSLTLIYELIDFLESIIDNDEFIEEHSNLLFEALMRVFMCISDNQNEKILKFMGKLKPTNIPQFDYEFQLNFVELDKNEEKEKKNDTKDLDDPWAWRRRLYERYENNPYFDDMFLNDPFLMRNPYLRERRMSPFRRDYLDRKRENKKVHIDNEIPFSHVITNVIAMTLVKKNVYINDEIKVKSSEIPKYIKNEAIDLFKNLPIPSEYFEASFPYLTASNYEDFLKAYSPHALPPTKTAIDFIISNLDAKSKFLPFIMKVLALIINDISDGQKRNIIFRFIFENIFVFNRDESIDDVSFYEAMIVASNACQTIINDRIVDFKIPDFEKYGINGNDYKQTKSKTGLANLGCTCYFNSILQQFYHIPTFRKILIEYKGDNQLFLELGKLFSRMRDGALKFVSPKNVTDNWTCWDGTKINSKIQEDASEFIIMMIDKVASIIPNSMFNGKISCKIEGINNDNGIYTKENEEPFCILILPINQLNTLEDCLNNFSSPTFYTNDNQYYADSLKKKIDAKQSEFIDKLPEHLILQLKRFEYDYTNGQRKKINSTVTISNEIDINSICKFKNNVNQCTKYRLSGVIQHMGLANGGHYISYVMERDTKDWYKCNDKEVTLVTLDDVIKDSNGNDSNAYILFYDRDDIIEVDDSIINPNISQQLATEKIMSSYYDFFMTKGFIQFLNHLGKRRKSQELAAKLIIKILPHANVETSNDYFDSLKERLENDESLSIMLQKELTDFKFLILNESSATNNLIVDKIINPMLSHCVSKNIILLAIETMDFAFERIPDSSFFFRVLYIIVKSAIKHKKELEKDIDNNKNKIDELNGLINIISDKTTHLLKSGIKEYISNQKDLSSNYIMKSIDLSAIIRLYNIYETIPNDFVELLKDSEFLLSLYSSKNCDVTFIMNNYIRARELGLFDVNTMLKAFFDKESIRLKMEPLFQSLLIIFKEYAFPMTWSLKFKYNDNFRTPQDIALCYTLLCKNGFEKEFLISNFKNWVPNLLMNESFEARKMGLAPFRYLIPHTFFKKAFGEIPKYNDSYVYTSAFFNSIELQSKATVEMKKNAYYLIQCLINSLEQLKELLLYEDYQSRVSFPIEKYKGLQLLKLLNVCIKIFNDCDDKDTNYPINYAEIIEFGEFLLTTGYSHPFDPHIVYVLKILRENCSDQLLIDSIPKEEMLMSPETITKISSSQFISYSKILTKIVDNKLKNNIDLSEEFYEKLFKMILFNLRNLTPIIKSARYLNSYNLLVNTICKKENAAKIILDYIDNHLETCLIEGFHTCMSVLVFFHKKRLISKYIHSYNFNKIFGEISIVQLFVYRDAIVSSGNDIDENNICYDTLFDDTSNVFQSLCKKEYNNDKYEYDHEYDNSRDVVWDYLINNTKKRINECPIEEKLNLQKALFRQFTENYNIYYFNSILDSQMQDKEIKYITQFVLQFINSGNDEFNNKVINVLIFMAKYSIDAMIDTFDVLKNNVSDKLKNNDFITDVFSNDFNRQNWEFVEKFSDFVLDGKSKEDISNIFQKSKIEARLNEKLNILSENEIKLEDKELYESIIYPYKLILKYDNDHFQKEKNTIIDNCSLLNKVAQLENKVQ